MGLALALSTGYWQLLGFSALNALTAVIASRFAKRGGTEQTAVELVGERVYFAGRRLPRWLPLWTKAQKLAVLRFLDERNLGPLRQQLLSVYGSARNELILGLDVGAKGPVMLDWQTQPHSLIIGPTGSGKSALLSRILAELAKLQKEDPVLRIWFFDYKFGETIRVNSSQLVAAKVAGSDNPAALQRAWGSLLDQLDREETSRRPRHILIIEELAEALADRDFAQTLGQLAAQGRSRGLRIIATNQSSSGIPRNLLVNFGNRLLLDGSDAAERMLLVSPKTMQRGMADISDSGTRYDGIFTAEYLNRGITFKFLPVWSD